MKVCQVFMLAAKYGQHKGSQGSFSSRTVHKRGTAGWEAAGIGGNLWVQGRKSQESFIHHPVTVPARS